MRLVAEGRTGREIADELHIAHDTARTHVRNAMTKLGARSCGPRLAIQSPLCFQRDSYAFRDSHGYRYRVGQEEA